jgi:hypothetical protein
MENAEPITKRERRKMEFVNEYAELCRRYGMMVDKMPDEDTGYHFNIVVYTPRAPWWIEQQMLELSVENLRIATP